MKNKIIKIVAYLLKFIPFSLLQKINKRPMIGVFYHAVSDSPMPHIDSIYPSISAAQFESEMVLLKSQFQFVSYKQIIDFFEKNIPLPKNAIHLSFDDGFLECHSIVMPILERLHIPCTFFITTDWINNSNMFFRNKVAILWEMYFAFNINEKKKILTSIENIFDTKFHSDQAFRKTIFSLKEEHTNIIDKISQVVGFNETEYLIDNPLYLSTSQIKDMHSKGFTIGAHTLSHPKLENVALRRMTDEISLSCKLIQDITGEKSVPFAFPNSATNIDRGELKSIINEHHHVGLLFNTKGVMKDEPFILNRIWAEKNLPNIKPYSRIPFLLKSAYIESTVEEIRKVFRN